MPIPGDSPVENPPLLAPRTWHEVRLFSAQDNAVNNESSSRMTLRLFRIGQWLERDRRWTTALPRRVWRVVNQGWCEYLVGIDLPALTHAGPGLRLRHAGRGLVVHPNCVIGSGVTIFHGVTLGTRGHRAGEVGGKSASAPTLGDGSKLLAGCVVVGGVSVGEGAVVGANVVLVEDLAAGCAVVPAKPRVLPPALLAPIPTSVPRR